MAYASTTMNSGVASNSAAGGYTLCASGYTAAAGATACTACASGTYSTSIPTTILSNLWLRLRATDYDAASRTWIDSSGNNRHVYTSATRGAPTVVTNAANSNGATNAFTAISGSSTDGFLLNNPYLASYTLFHVVRYSSSSNKGRIVDAADGSGGYGSNWLSGFCNGAAGVAFHQAWFTPSSDFYGTNWVVSSDSYNTYRSNGASRTGLSSGVTGVSWLPPISVNYGSPECTTQYQVADILIFNSQLTSDQITQVEAYLNNMYGVGTYASAPSFATSQCVSVPAGYFATINGISTSSAATDITICPENTFSSAGSSVCSACSSGKSAAQIPTTNLYYQFKAEDYDATSKIWVESSGNNRHSTAITGAPYLVTQSSGSNGAQTSFQALHGSTTDIINEFNSPPITGYTLFHVARYAGSNMRRIFSNPTSNWLSGFWAGAAGVAYHNGWITNTYDTGSHSVTTSGSYWTLSTDFAYNYRSNGVSNSAYPTQNIGDATMPYLGINALAGELSDWEVAEVILYNALLSADQINQVEAYLGTKYGIAGYLQPGTLSSNSSSARCTAVKAGYYPTNSTTLGYTACRPGSWSVASSSACTVANAGTYVQPMSRFLRIDDLVTNPGDGYMNVAEITVLFKGTPLTGLSVKLSSHLDPTGATYSEALATDGVLTTFAHTKNDQSVFLSMDLTGRQFDTVVVFSRQDCCQNRLAGARISIALDALGSNTFSSQYFIAQTDLTYTFYFGDFGATPNVPINCPAGTYQPLTSMTSSSACIACSIGSYSAAGSASCTKTPPGQFSVNTVYNSLSSSGQSALLTILAPFLVQPAYTGPVFNLRRSTDGASSDFYADTNGNLGTMYLATGTSLSSWLTPSSLILDQLSAAGRSSINFYLSYFLSSSSYTGPLFAMRRSTDSLAQNFYADALGNLGTKVGGTGTSLASWLGGQTTVLDKLSVSGQASIQTALAPFLTSSTYMGPVFNIRRSSDNVVIDVYADALGNIGLAYNATGTSLATWLNGATAYVVIWYDQSGNNFHAVQTTASMQPFYDPTFHLVDFTYSSTPTWMNIGTGFLPAGNLPYTFVTKHGKISSSNGGLFGQGKCGPSTSSADSFRNNNGGYWWYWWNADMGIGSSTVTGNTISASYDLANRRGYLNGALTNTVAQTSRGCSLGNAFLGKSICSEYLNGQLYFVFTSNIVLANADRALLENSLPAQAFVTQWYDQSGNGRHATQSNGALQPIYNFVENFIGTCIRQPTTSSLHTRRSNRIYRIKYLCHTHTHSHTLTHRTCQHMCLCIKPQTFEQARCFVFQTALFL